MENAEMKTNQPTTTTTAAAPVADFARLEELARTANDMNSFSDYKPGSATAKLRKDIEEARENLEHGLKRCKTEKQKEDLSAKYYSYVNKITSYYFDYYRNESACPSVLISGPANFPTKKKAAQNSRRDALIQEWRRLEDLKQSLFRPNTAISADDPQAVEALEKQIEARKKSHAFKVAANAYYRKNKTFKGMEGLDDEKAEKLDDEAKAAAARMGGRVEPFPAWSLSNENAEIKRLESRLESLKAKQENTLCGWNFDGGRVEIDAENNRIGVYFDERTSGAALEELHRKNNDLCIPRLLWSPRFQRWQCQNNAHNLRALVNSKTYAATDEESKNAIKAEDERRKEKAAAKEAEKAAEEEKKAESRKVKAAALNEKQQDLKKTGFILKPSMLNYCNLNLSEYMKAGHGIRRIIRIDDERLLTVEISYNHQWNDVKKPKYILVSINEAKETKDAVITGSEFMNANIKLRDVPEAEKRQLSTLKGYAEQYKPETDDARILALYEAWKRGEITTVKTWGHLEGTTLHEESAREFLKNWKPGTESPKQEEPEPVKEEPQEEPKQEQDRSMPAPYCSIKAEQLTLF